MGQPALIAMLKFDGLTAFGLIAVGLMLLFYALEARSPVYVLAFAGACVLGSIYGFLQGAWPFGLVEAVWSAVALRRWLRTDAAHRRKRRLPPPAMQPQHYSGAWLNEQI
jgi:hypothetical protein